MATQKYLERRNLIMFATKVLRFNCTLLNAKMFVTKLFSNAYDPQDLNMLASVENLSRKDDLVCFPKYDMTVLTPFHIKTFLILIRLPNIYASLVKIMTPSRHLQGR